MEATAFSCMDRPYTIQQQGSLFNCFVFLQRLNERRDLLRTHYHEPIIFAFPLSFQEQCRLAAPDLWSIRNFSETISRPPTPKTPPLQPDSSRQGPASESSQPVSSDYLDLLLKEWERTRQTDPQNESLLYLTQCTANELLKYKQLHNAQEVIEQGLRIAKAMENKREIYVCLNIFRDIAKLQGRPNDAQASFKESLDISRRLAKILGDSPESLRDLCVSLSNNGILAVEREKLTQSKIIFKEGLDIANHLAILLPDLPEYEDLYGYFSQQLDTFPDNNV